MASELGGVSVGLVIGNGINPPPPDQFNAISDFFKGFYDHNISQTPGTQVGESVLTTDTGRVLHIFDNTAGQTFHFADGGDGAVGTGHGGNIVAGQGDNDIIITDDTSYRAKLGGGDDFLRSTGAGPIDVRAGSGNDAVMGGSADDTIRGQSGNDYLQGGAGNDTILGGVGRDTLVGGPGNDVMSGGPGGDTFIFGNEVGGHDTITDFSKRDILKILDRTGDGHVTVGPGADIESIVHDAVNDTITLTLKGGDTVLLEQIKNDKLDLTETDDGIFMLKG